MLALQLETTHTKSFMGRLLREELFDPFEVRSMDIHAGVLATVDGLQDPPNEEAPPTFASWQTLRQLALAIIKISPKPKYVKLVLSYQAQGIQDIHPNAAALFLNITYENDTVTFTTGTAQREFLLEKSLDQNWDSWVMGFFKQHQIPVVERG